MSYRLLTTTALVLALSAPAFAGSTEKATQAQPSTEPPAAVDLDTGSEIQPTAPGAEAQPDAEIKESSDQPIIDAQASDEWRAEDVIGLAVTNLTREDVGEVNDLLFAKDGKIRGVVLSVGGFLGVGDKLVAMPWDAVTVDQEQGLVLVSLSKQDLEAAPAFKTLEQQQAEQEAMLREQEQAREMLKQQQKALEAPAAPAATE